MANFVEFEYKDLQHNKVTTYTFNIDTIASIYIDHWPKKTSHDGKEQWWVKVDESNRSLAHSGYGFRFETLDEAQALYDKLRGKESYVGEIENFIKRFYEEFMDADLHVVDEGIIGEFMCLNYFDNKYEHAGSIMEKWNQLLQDIIFNKYKKAKGLPVDYRPIAKEAILTFNKETSTIAKNAIVEECKHDFKLDGGTRVNPIFKCEKCFTIKELECNHDDSQARGKGLICLKCYKILNENKETPETKEPSSDKQKLDQIREILNLEHLPGILTLSVEKNQSFSLEKYYTLYLRLDRIKSILEDKE